MKEIRLCMERRQLSRTEPHTTAWIDDVPEARAGLEVLVKAGNRKHGAGSHWLESRAHSDPRLASEVGAQADAYRIAA